MTLKDVAARAGVHFSTASRALDEGQSWRLSEETVERVKRAAAELHYAPDLVASGLKRGRTGTVAVIVADLGNPYNAPLIKGISAELELAGSVALVAESQESSQRLEQLLEHFARRRVDAIVTAATRLGDGPLFERVVAGKIPVVLAVRGLADGSYTTIVHDDVGGGELAAKHLIRLGHRRLAQLRGPADIDTFERRARGFAAAVSAAEATDLSGEEAAAVPDLAEGRRLMEVLLDGRRHPSAVFAPTDVMAVGALEAIEGRGLTCPGDISLVGYDDVPLAPHLSPPLTTVSLPGEEIGRRAGAQAMRLIADPAAEPELVELPATLIERRSSAPPRSG